MVHIAISELFKQPMGVEVIIKDDRYLYLGRDSLTGDRGLYNYKTGEIITCDELPDNIMIYVGEDVNLDKLLRLKLRDLLLLVGDGWRDSDTLDMTSAIEEYKMLVKIKRITDGAE
jgi:hypothetical protein